MKTSTWTQPTLFGDLLIEAGAQGVRHVDLNGSTRKRSAANGAAAASQPPAALGPIAKAFERYFAGDAHALDGVPVDWSAEANDFRRTVLATLHELVGPGKTISYGELAAAVGHPGAARAVGSAMANNPVPIIVPCHRVLAADGTLGGYGGGLDMKRGLLQIEGIYLPGSRRRAS
jgi:methylated-DNA-[protein]-cysteine S-methyltransferase